MPHGRSTIVIHAAGWLEGGLTVSYEKLVTDMEILQMVAEMCHQYAGGPDVNLGALAEIGGRALLPPSTQ